MKRMFFALAILAGMTPSVVARAADWDPQELQWIKKSGVGVDPAQCERINPPSAEDMAAASAEGAKIIFCFVCTDASGTTTHICPSK